MNCWAPGLSVYKLWLFVVGDTGGTVIKAREEVEGGKELLKEEDTEIVVGVDALVTTVLFDG